MLIRLSQLAEKAKSIGGRDAIVYHSVNENANSWHNTWNNLEIDFFQGSVSVSVSVAYDKADFINGFGCISDPTGMAITNERKACELLRSLGYNVISENEPIKL